MNPWRECWTWCSIVLTSLICHACFRVIHIEGGLRQSSECIETKLWTLHERSSRLVKTRVWGLTSTALFLFSPSKNVHFLSSQCNVCIHRVFSWYVHLFSLAVGSTCLPASQTILWNADGPIFPFFLSCLISFQVRLLDPVQQRLREQTDHEDGDCLQAFWRLQGREHVLQYVTLISTWCGAM